MKKILYPIVDDDDVIIDWYEKEIAYQKGMQLRSIQIFVFNDEGKLFVQQRSHNKKRFPSYYCASVAGHVEPNESYEDASHRELYEELGIKESLTHICTKKTPVGDGEYAMMSHFDAKTTSKIKLQKKEIDSGDFYSIEEIKDMIKMGKLFTPSFIFSFDKIIK